jgi:hypothetical protein
MTTLSFVGKIGPDRTVQLPADAPVGAEVAVVVMPPLEQLLKDPERRARFAATLAAIRKAVDERWPSSIVTDEEIVRLVKRARQNKPDA